MTSNQPDEMSTPRQQAAALMRRVQLLLATAPVPLEARRDAVERAFGACAEALDLLDESDRAARGTVWFNLGVCWRSRLTGDPRDNAEQAISSFATALAHRDRQREADEWAKAQNALGVAWGERRTGDTAENKRAAIEALESALAVRRQLGDGDYLAATLTNLANVRLTIGGHARSQHIAQAVAEYREALELLSGDNVETRAPILFNFATALLESPDGDRAGNVEAAIDALEQALALETGPHERHAAKLALANALALRVSGVKAENLERAVALVDEVVGYRERHETPERQAAAHNSRGIIYARRIRGGRADNLEDAISSYRRALDVYTADAFPANRAGALNNLATALRARMLGDREMNEEGAVASLREALDVYTRAIDPYSWAGTMSNLGTAYFERQTGNRNDNIESAISAYRSALEVRREDALPWEWAATQFNLGQALWRRYSGDRIANLRAAADELAATLRVRSRERTSDEWAATQSMLAVVRDELAELTNGDVEQAMAAYEAALSVYQPESFPSETRANANNLAGLLLRTGDPARALEVARIGLRAAELLYEAAPTEDGREPELDDNARLYRLASEAALESGRPDAEAFELGEGGRGRLLGDWLAAGALPPPDGLGPELPEREAHTQAQLREALLAARRAGGGGENRRIAVARVETARCTLDELWQEMAQVPQAASYVMQRRGERLTADGLQSWLDSQPGRPAILVLSTLRERPLAFVAAAGGDGPRAIRYTAKHDEVDERLARFQQEVLRASVPARRETWTDIGEMLMAPALAAIGEDASLLYIVPLGRLHAIPWHASLIDGTPLLERFPVTYAPSASAASRLTDPAATTRPDARAVVVGDPDGTLRHAKREAEVVAGRLGATPLLGAAATAAITRAALSTARWAHLAAHGHYDETDPLASGIKLADRVLTARELIDDRVPDTLVVSTCESGRQAAMPGDELWGLARALLYAGTRTAILSLWRVGDRVTERLMARFYDALHVARSPESPVVAASLREAMLETREEDPRSFLWAPFALLGNPY